MGNKKTGGLIEKHMKLIKNTYISLLIIGFAILGIFMVIKEHAPIYIVIFTLISIGGIVPILRKKLSYWDTRILVTKWALKVIVAIVIIGILCKLTKLPIFEWTL